MIKIHKVILLCSLSILMGCGNYNEQEQKVTLTNKPINEVAEQTTENEELSNSEIQPTMEIIPEIKILPNVSVGDYVTFGNYEQDFERLGVEPIEWIVLDKKDGNVLLISKEGIDSKPFHTKNEAVTWENCSLREWLNGEFYNKAFDAAEQAVIADTLVLNSSKKGNGNDTNDKIFLLSASEVKRYFGTEGEEERLRIKATDYAKARGEGYSECVCHHSGMKWRLRTIYESSSVTENLTEVVSIGGEFFYDDVDSKATAVRPALWVACSSEEFIPTPTPLPSQTFSGDIVTALKQASVGDYINFGKYEQDNNVENGKENIEWLILEKKFGKAFVMSKYVLDVQPYNQYYEDVTWKTCSLREWLNEEFYNNAFSVEEQHKISKTTVEVIKDDSGRKEEIKDKIFLLSKDEVYKYFHGNIGNSYMRTTPTEYAISQGVRLEEIDIESYGNCNWWLRTKGYYAAALAMFSSGRYYEGGQSVNHTTIGVRPAFWINYAN